MKIILIDLNIVLDYLRKRAGHEKALEIMIQCSRKGVLGYLCAHEVTTLSYFLEKENKDKKKNRMILSGILSLFEIIEVSKAVLEKAISSNVSDYEDAVIVESAKEYHVDYIVTRNTKDFINSPVQVITPEAYLAI